MREKSRCSRNRRVANTTEASTDVRRPGRQSSTRSTGYGARAAFDGVALQRTIDGEVTRVDAGVGTTHIGRKSEWGSGSQVRPSFPGTILAFVTVCAAPSVRAKVAFADVIESFGGIVSWTRQ